MRYKKKIKPLNELAELLSSLRSEGNKIVHCHGVFDLLHVGHIRYLEHAKKMGDTLVVTVTQDHHVNKGPNRPAFTEHLRAESLAALDCVDYVAVNQWPTAVETIKLLKPDFYVKGSDYKDSKDDITGKIKDEAEAVQSIGGEIRFTEDITFSSSHLINSIIPSFDEETNRYLHDFRRKYSPDDILSQIENLRELKVLVIGEAIIDEYVYCESMGKSGKESVLVMKYLSKERYAGGALAIANHLADFCDSVSVACYLGAEKTEEDFVRNTLKANIDPLFVYKSESPTIVKRRFVDSYSLAKLLGVYKLNGEQLNPDEENILCNILEERLPEYDVVIVADYDHGLLTPNVIDLLTNKSRFLAVNTQINAANMGFHAISKYAHADYVCIHEGEIRLDRRSRKGDLKDLVHDLANRMGDPSIMITRGSNGSLFYRKDEGFTSCPAFAVKVVDRIGAGDAVLALTAVMSADSIPADVINFVGNLVGADAVSIVGNERSIDRVKLLKSITGLMK
ncbi:MAG: PfkB family carbohydrate kinase [Syntrophales bacterium]|nr:PfkB family carbohydrate kinase [Syntrophales bacterium]